MLAPEEELLSAPILELIKQTARGRLTIATRSSRFLIVCFERTRHLVMDHETYVRFVDAHSKRVRRDDRFQLTVHERILVPFPIARLHAPVILLDLEVESFQPIRQLLGRLNSCNIDDADALVFIQYANELLVLLTLVCNALDFKMKIRSIDACLHHLQFSEIELLLDVRGDFRRRGGS